jgi:hypothetical protein
MVIPIRIRGRRDKNFDCSAFTSEAISQGVSSLLADAVYVVIAADDDRVNLPRNNGLREAIGTDGGPHREARRHVHREASFDALTDHERGGCIE